MPEAAVPCASGKLRRTILRTGAFLTTGLGLSSHNSLAAQAPPPAIAGDLLLAPAGDPFLSQHESLPPGQNELIVFSL